MYTIIYAREKQSDSYDGIIHVECVKTEKEVHDFIRFKTFDQERLETEAYRYHGQRYNYGDYGFLVIHNGASVYDRNFQNTTDECIVPYQPEGDLLDCYQDQVKGVEQNARMAAIISEMDTDEKAYQKSRHSYREEVKKQEEVAKEKALLKQLLEKYPDIKK